MATSKPKPPWLKDKDKNDNGVKDSKDKKNMDAGKKKKAAKKK